jgi:hypothetical protein
MIACRWEIIFFSVFGQINVKVVPVPILEDVWESGDNTPHIPVL